MPEMDGIELTSLIRAEESLRDICLLMLSSAAFDEESLKATDAGVDLYLTKPVRLGVLFESLVTLMGDAITENADDDTKKADAESITFSGNILVAEDNLVNQDVAREMLDFMGCQVEIAEDGRGAIELAKTGNFDLILMDCHMPEVDGFEASIEIRKYEKTAGIKQAVPIIALTGDVRMGIKEHCQEAGMNDYMSKPFSLGELEITLGQWLETKSGKAEANTSQQELQSEDKVDVVVDSVLDQKRLDMIRAMQRPGRPNVLDRIIGLFQDNSPAVVRNIRQSIVEKDSDDLCEAAHSLKSSSANLGATHLSALCKKLEELGRAGQLEGTEELLEQLEGEFQEVVLLLSAELENSADE